MIWEFSLRPTISSSSIAACSVMSLPASSGPYITIFARSIIQATLATVFCLIIGFPTAFFIATRDARTRSIWLFLVTVPYWVNLLIRTVSMKFLIRDNGPLNEFLLAIGVISEPIAMINTNFAVQLGLFYSYLPFMVLPVYAAVERYDFSLSEAAADLYAGRWTVLRRLLLPVVRPGIVAGCILVFVPSSRRVSRARSARRRQELHDRLLIEEQFKGNAGNWPFGAAASMILLSLVLVALLFHARQRTASDKA